MLTIPCNTPKPGHFEVDLVHYYDEDNSREYIHTYI